MDCSLHPRIRLRLSVTTFIDLSEVALKVGDILDCLGRQGVRSWRTEPAAADAFSKPRRSSFRGAHSAASFEICPIWAPTWICRTHLVSRTSLRGSFRVRSTDFRVVPCGGRSAGLA